MALSFKIKNFHTQGVSGTLNGSSVEVIPTVRDWEVELQFYSHFHPYVDQLSRLLIMESVRGLQAADTKLDDEGENYAFFKEMFSMSDSSENPPDYICTNMVRQPYPVKDIDFTYSGAYSVYNWELFYHIPLTVAIHLMKNNRFEEAQKWLHYIFDPTDSSEGSTPERFWKVKPFQTNSIYQLQDILISIVNEDPTEDAPEPGDEDYEEYLDKLELQKETVQCIQAWMNNPFRPHLVARYRQSAYMYKAVFAYLDNLIAWGDYLFRQDTGETINEAMQIYVLAANILGPRPQEVPSKKKDRPKTYAQLREGEDSSDPSTTRMIRALENDIPFSQLATPEVFKSSTTAASLIQKSKNTSISASTSITLSAGIQEKEKQEDSLAAINTLSFQTYFCSPHNDKMFDYWDTIADRLFKIRNSLNIKGIFRQLPLFEPPIDPAMLARAVAAGLDIGAVIAGLNQPLPLVRFRLLIAKAQEICQEVKSLGSNLLSVLEKIDGEALSILRAKQERVVLEMAETIKYGQWQEAIKSREGLEKAIENAARRYVHYERLLGKKKSEITIPEMDKVDSAELVKMAFELEEPEMEYRSIDINFAENVESNQKISKREQKEFKHLGAAHSYQENAQILDLIASGLSTLPVFSMNSHPEGVGTSVSWGSDQYFRVYSLQASGLRILADQQSYKANKAAKMGSYERREQDWEFQSNVAAGEVTATFKQLRAAQIREAVAERDWKNHKRQIRHAKEIEKFLSDEKKGKTTNKDFYTWMKREVKGLYSKCYEFAYDVAKKAERALQHEMGDPNLTYLKFAYMTGKEGLLAGEKLHMDLKRMEMEYHELNEREYELTKHISLLQVDPLALILLRATGKCTFSIPEEIYDLDCPGHYFRRIKSVAVSVPCVTGPYTGVNCRLSLQKSRIRKSSIGDYAENSEVGTEDERFDTYRGNIQSIVTSSAQGDSGLFETNLNDERYLPFENCGAIGTWELKLPGDPSQGEPCQFDYNTISDVILHIRYTAREGGDRLRAGAISNLQEVIRGNVDSHLSRVRLFSVRHEFPNEWASFKSVDLEGSSENARLEIPLVEEHYPYWSRNLLCEAIPQIILVAKAEAETGINADLKVLGVNKLGSMDGNLPVEGLSSSILTREDGYLPIIAPFGSTLTIDISDNSMDDLFLAVTWGDTTD